MEFEFSTTIYALDLFFLLFSLVMMYSVSLFKINVKPRFQFRHQKLMIFFMINLVHGYLKYQLYFMYYS